MLKQILILTIVLLCSCQNGKKTSESAAQTKRDTSKKGARVDNNLKGYNELSNEDSLDRFTISEYNTDLEDAENIQRPKESRIENSKFSKEKLFGVWVQDPGPETPHATFELTEKSFFIVDYDGDGEMPFLIKDDSITVYYNDFIERGRILESKKSDELIIHWKDSKKPTVYYTWKN